MLLCRIYKRNDFCLSKKIKPCCRAKGNSKLDFAGSWQRMETDMYKKQMILQRIVCYVVLIAAALVFVYSLGLVTDLYDNDFSEHASDYYIYGDDPSTLKIKGTEIYYDIQEFNRNLTAVGVGLILLAASQFVFQNHSRRKYYIANYITVGANTIGVVAASVWALTNIFQYKNRYLTTVDVEALITRLERKGKLYNDSMFWFDVSSVVFGILLVATLFNVINFIWKLVLMNSEKKLVKAGKEGKAV